MKSNKINRLLNYNNYKVPHWLTHAQADLDAYNESSHELPALKITQNACNQNVHHCIRTLCPVLKNSIYLEHLPE